MATKNDQAKSEGTESLLTCPICLEYFVKPKSLTCLNTFCSPCLEKVQNRLRKLIVCPMCKSVTPLPTQGVKGLPSDFKIQQMKDILLRSNDLDSEDARLCDVCKGKDGKEAAFHCAKCSVFYCGDCVVKHNSNTMFHDHTVSDLSPDQMNWALFCKKHQSHKVSFYCQSCKPHVLLCPICILDHDSRHDMSGLNVVAESVRKDLTEGLVKLKEKSSLLQDYLTKVRERKSYYDVMLLEAQEKISMQATILVEAVRNEEIRMLGEAQERFEELVSRFKLDEVSSALSGIDNLQIDIENTLNASSGACVISHETLSERLKLMKNSTTLPQNTPQTGLEFIPGLTASQVSLGTLATCKLPKSPSKAEDAEQPDASAKPEDAGKPNAPTKAGEAGESDGPTPTQKIRDPPRDLSICDDCERQKSPLFSTFCMKEKKLKRLCRMCKGMRKVLDRQAKNP